MKQWVEQGFTLIELIVVILILSTVSVGVTSYIHFGIDVYLDTVGRDRQIGDSRFLISRMTRELREALPNSIRVNGSCIEFVAIGASSTYIVLPVAPQAAAAQVTLVLPALTPELATSNKLVVYPLNPVEVYVDPDGSSGKVFLLGQVVSSGKSSAVIGLKNSVQFQSDSPTQRYFLIGSAVSYCVEGTDVIRYDSYWPIGPQQPPPASAQVSLMAQNQVNNNPFNYHHDTLTRNAIAQLNFVFRYDDEDLELFHEVHIVNVP
ncbi:MAG: prepilin-type N-terminal cleavage/methylation domain-containing protein [Gammaproteobacteria bacterium]|nr:prepilin-type N-terminal cleavage/methylation domain-containing protein [Gammaproteobacteria bacterium]